MMKTFQEIYKEVFDKKKKWDYYSDNGIHFEYPFSETSRSSDFIKNYIEMSGKSVNKLFNKIEELEPYRLTHIISTFFLGVHLYENSKTIKNAIDNELQQFCKSDNVQFSYIWFLISLFHDLGYSYENGKGVKYKSLKNFIRHQSARRKLGNCIGIPQIYGAIHEKYFLYRISKQNKNDHGICAAHVLHNDLCEIREELEQEHNPDTHVSWKKSLEKVYNYASWIILAHNMWYVKVNDNNAKCYQCYGLDELILCKDEYKISLEKYPFLFLFCLVDSIEPLKRIKDITLLDKLFLEIDDKKQKLILKSELKCACHERVIEQAKDMNNWLTPVEEAEDEIEIKLVS